MSPPRAFASVVLISTPVRSTRTDSTHSSARRRRARERGRSLSILISRGVSDMASRSEATVPAAATRPSTIATTRPAMRSTSRSTWEDTMMVRPSLPSRRISSMRRALWIGSVPLSGSSRSSTSGSCTSAAATLARCRMPFEKVDSRRSAASVSSTVSIARRAAPDASGTLYRAALHSTNRRAVM